jgi:osmoprotectant transport system substrate-binding protein/osmoprotectant transport system permease protein
LKIPRFHRKRILSLIFIVALFFLYSWNSATERDKLVIGSKRFTESYILGEILKEIAEEVDETPVDYREGLGNTGIVFKALQEGLIDIYPEYTGTIVFEILKKPELSTATPDQLNAYLKPLKLAVSKPLGFQNNYALAMLDKHAEELKINTISDLANHPELILGFSHEFLGRLDGWKGLKKSDYRFPQTHVKSIDHSLSYEALLQNKIDVTDIYTTDPKIAKFNLRVLKDDKHFFPIFEGVLFYRIEAEKAFPRTWEAFQKRLENQMTNQQILNLNDQAELEDKSFEEVAQFFLHPNSSSNHNLQRTFWEQLFGADFLKLTRQHLFLVFGALVPAIIIGLLLGILASFSLVLRHFILNLVGAIQTIPALALLAFLIPIFKEIGTVPALVALFFYSLLPIVRNTYAGLTNISPSLRDAGLALGLPFIYRLYLIEIPLASPMILAGIKTAAVLNVGMATIAALIGAGGYGERILAGLALNDYPTLLSGAIPACLLAICVQLSFDLLDYILIPRGLKLTNN